MPKLSFPKNIFSYGVDEKPGLLTLILVVITILTKLIGLIYSIYLVNNLGVNSIDKSIFDTASTIPELLSNVLLLGSISASVIPVMTYIRTQKGDKFFYESFALGLKLFFLVFTIVAILVSIFAQPLMLAIIDYFASLQKDPKSLTDLINLKNNHIEEIVLLVRLLMIPQIILGISAYFASSLQVIHKFVIPQLTGLFYNFGQLFGVILLGNLFHIRPLWAIVIGTFAAALLHMSIQIPLLAKSNYIASIKENGLRLFAYSQEELQVYKQMLLLSVPRMISSSIDFVLNNYFKFLNLSLGIAQQQRYIYSGSIMMIPFSLFVQTYIVLAFPQLTKAFSEGDMGRVQEIFERTALKILFYTIPIVSVLLILRIAIVRLTFGLYPSIGRFTWDDTLAIAYLIFFATIGVVPQVLYNLYSRLFFAARNTMLPLILNFVLLIISIYTAQIFANYFSYFSTLNINDIGYYPEYFATNHDLKNLAASSGGIALGFSISQWLILIVFMIIAGYKYFKLTIKYFWFGFINLVVGGFIMSLFMYFSSKIWEYSIESSTVFGLVVLTGSTILLGLVVYYIAALYLKIDEAYYVKSKLAKLLTK